MGLSSFPSPAEGMLPVLVMNTVLSAALIKNMLKSMLQMMGATSDQPNSEEEESSVSNERERRVSITRYESLCKNRCNAGKSCGGGGGNGSLWPATMECCVCLNRFKAEEKILRRASVDLAELLEFQADDSRLVVSCWLIRSTPFYSSAFAFIDCLVFRTTFLVLWPPWGLYIKLLAALVLVTLNLGGK